MFNDVQLQQQQKSSINSASYSSPEKNHGNKSPVEDKGVRISGTMPAISKSFHQSAEIYKFHKHIVLVK